MAAHDLLLRLGGVNDTIGKSPYFRTAGIDYHAGPPITYVNNSLEGVLFDENAPGSGIVDVPGGTVNPNFNYFENVGAGSSVNIVDGAAPGGISRTNGLVTVNIVAHSLSVGDIFSITGITFDGTHTILMDGVYKVFQVIDADHFQFIKLGEDFVKTYYTYPLAITLFEFSDPAVTIFDNRQPADASGISYSSILLSPKDVANTVALRKRITPEDLYVRFSIADSTGLLGGLNSNIFDVIDVTTEENVKPIIWAWFFGGLTKVTSSDFTSADRTTNNIFDILFNSYAVVLRPTGTGSYLEFALLKFNWGTITSANWFTDFIDTALINKYDNINGVDLGYLISTNPDVAKIADVSKITEIAKSSSFFYDSEIPFEMNLKISIRKHLLTDQSTDNSYYFQLAINQDYDSFGDAAIYSNIMHAFIQRPKTNGLTTIAFQLAGYVSAITSDLGKDVKDGLTTVGTLAWYDNTNRIWWLKNVADTIADLTALTIDTGTGAGTTTGASIFDSGLSFVNPITGVNTIQSNYLLMPWMYLKYINLNPTAYGVNASTIKIDNVLFKQLNSSNKLYF
jgi:hypothetical protein